jgi:SAM-dependent methyltransferase
MSGRRQHVPWKAAGTASESEHSADDVVRETGWVFNNVTGDELNLAEFVKTGDDETVAYLQAFGLIPSPPPQSPLPLSLVEIGSGIGRMTSSFTRLYQKVVACDLDAAFLERCRDTVAEFGNAGGLQTCHVIDGRTLDLADQSADVVFSYITLQHCHHADALALTREAVRLAKPGGRVLLNYRTWVGKDVVLWPAGKVVRANRLSPGEVMKEVGRSLSDVQVFRSPERRPFAVERTTDATFDGIDPSHWWLVATVR